MLKAINVDNCGVKVHWGELKLKLIYKAKVQSSADDNKVRVAMMVIGFKVRSENTMEADKRRSEKNYILVKSIFFNFHIL